MRLRKFVLGGISAALVAACSGHQTTSLLPETAQDAQQSVSQGILKDAPGIQQNTVTTIEVQGTIAGMTTGQNFILNDNVSGGKVPVTVGTSTVVNTHSASVSTGKYIIAVGAGSTASSLNATYVAAFPSAPASTTLTGTVTGTTAFGFDLRTSSGIDPIMISGATTVSGTIAANASVSVTAAGNSASGFYATRVSVGGAATPAPTTSPVSGVPAHLLTGDYLGTPYGTTLVSPGSAAPYLNWAQTSAANAASIHNAGIKVEVYTNPNRLQTNDPLYKTTASSGFATVCAGSRVYDVYAGSVVQYVTQPASSALRSSYAALVKSMIGSAPVDALFEDNAGPLGLANAAVFHASLPCNYSDSAWLSGEQGLEAGAGKPTIFNGLSGLNGHDVSMSIGLLNNASTIGGTYEHCYSDAATHPNALSWAWVANENTQIQVDAKHKLFVCMGRNPNPAITSAAQRIYMLASFELAYDPNYSVYWTEFGTPSGFHVLPETKFVALSPVVSTPSSITSLLNSSGTYVRQYNACYYAGRLIGKCAMVVNSDYYTHTIPSSILSQYHHSLAVSGNDVLEGGSVSFSGPLPSATVLSGTASVLLP